MATSDNRQLISKLTFFPSYPLYAYANGLLYSIYIENMFDYSYVAGFESISADVQQKCFDLISLNPSKRNILTPGATEAYIKYYHKGRGTEDSSLAAPQDFYMVLGHNFNETSTNISFHGNSINEIVNGCVSQPPEYDGWSYMEANEAPQVSNVIKFRTNNSCEVGTILWGKKWEAPQNAELNQSLSISYGNTIRTTTGGKKISTMNYDGPAMWGDLHAWELLPDIEKDESWGGGTQYEPPKGGLRTWTVNFNQLQSKHMMPQNSNLTNYGWTQDSTGNYDMDANNDSLYQRSTSTDFFSRVYRLTMGSHLPCVIRISESNNPDQFAIVRISNYKITEVNPKMVNISLTLEEQV